MGGKSFVTLQEKNIRSWKFNYSPVGGGEFTNTGGNTQVREHQAVCSGEPVGQGLAEEEAGKAALFSLFLPPLFSPRGFGDKKS